MAEETETRNGNRQLTDQEIAGIALVIHGVEILRIHRADMAARGIDVPSQWTGGPRTREFVLGLGFPGGPQIARMAADGRITIDFPRGLTSARDIERHRFDFSFSGLKTSVARWVELAKREGREVPVADVSASFQEAVVDVLLRKALDACAETGVAHLLIGGGVAANSRLRSLAEQRCEAAGVQLRVRRPGMCTDNGAVLAGLGLGMASAARPPGALGIDRHSALPVTEVLL